MQICIENITPKRAEVFLNRNKSNRRLREGVVEKYAEDMKQGRWTNCPVPISFYEDGDVADGQHRLWAIVESQCAQKFPVMRGLSRADGLNIDTGRPRTVVDNARISGKDDDLSNQLISYAFAIELGQRVNGSRSPSMVIEVVAKHRESAQFAIACGPVGRNIRNAAVMGAIARAWYTHRRSPSEVDRLKRFCDVLGRGFAEGAHESAAVSLRNYLLAKPGGLVATSQSQWRDTFLKTMNAISYFMRGKELTVIKAVKEEVYPLPSGKAGK